MINSGEMSKDILKVIKEAGYLGGRVIFCKYCGLVKKGTEKEKNLRKIPRRFIKKQDVIRKIWSGKEMDENDIKIIYNKYPELSILEDCVKDFREVFKQKTVEALHAFIRKYSNCSIHDLKSFAKGLSKDIAAVEQAVISIYSNGITEGNNHRLKLIKRLMYGRAKLPLLKVKVIANPIFLSNNTQI